MSKYHSIPFLDLPFPPIHCPRPRRIRPFIPSRTIILLLIQRRLIPHGRTKPTPLPQSAAIPPKRNRDGHQQQGDAAQQRTRPLDAQAGEHLAGEEWEASCGDGAEEGVAGYC